MDEARRFLEILIPVLRIALAVAIAVFVVALLSKALGPVVRWAEPRILPRLARRARARHGVAPDAPRWACRACSSINEATAAACYRCGAPAGDVGDALPDREGVPDALWQPLAPTSRFDPSLYRGPGAPALPAEDPRAAAPPAQPPDPMEDHRP